MTVSALDDHDQVLPESLRRCPNCGALGLPVFYELQHAPVNSMVLLPDREQALGFPTGDVALGYCEACDFICNVAFDPRRTEYGEGYEASQGYSETFNAFHTALAKSLIERYGLRGKDIIEIGCGQGEFLALLCELGGNRGVGFDPAYVGGRIPAAVADRITIIKDVYTERHASYRADFVCCKMTLEHIPDTAGFVATVRRAMVGQPDATVFFQVPNMTHVLGEIGFWDIYYEHCSYFSARALDHLFRGCGFAVLGTRVEYGDQYLMIEAKPGADPLPRQPAVTVNSGRLTEPVARFAAQCDRRIAAWRQRLDGLRRQGRRAVVWGGGSKAVTFLTTLQAGEEIACVVDINPFKQGTFLAGTGHAVVAPEALREERPDVVIVMNPIYCAEIGRQLDSLGLKVDLLPITVVA